MHSLTVVPTYNESANILAVVAMLRDLPVEADVLVVDDASPDGTADLVELEYGGNRSVSVLRRTGKRGLGRSYVDAYALALERGYDRIVQMDADLSHDPASVPALLAAADEHDVVLGSRYCRSGRTLNWPLRRRLLSRAANLYVRTILGLPVRDCTSGFRCHTRRAIERMRVSEVMSDGYAFMVEMTYRAVRSGLKVGEVPICFTERRAGASKMGRRVIWESAVMPWRLRASMSGLEARSAAVSKRA